jgi:hypothetical protein
MGRGVVAHGRVGELRAADPPLQPFEQPHEVPLDRRPIGSRPAGGPDRLERTRDRKPRIDPGNVQDPLCFEVEDARILAAVRDLQDASAPALVVDEESLVALAAKRNRRAGQPEEVGGDLRRVLRWEARRRCLEDVQRR